MTTASLAAMAKISAHDTTPGHAFSTAVLILSMALNPRTDRLLGPACCSPVKLAVSDKSIDPSHPCKIYIEKIVPLVVSKMRSKDHKNACIDNNLRNNTRKCSKSNYVNEAIVEEEAKN